MKSVLVAAMLVLCTAVWGQGYPLPALGTSLADIKKAYPGLQQETDPAVLEAVKQECGGGELYSEIVDASNQFRQLHVLFKHDKLWLVSTLWEVEKDEVTFLRTVLEAVATLERLVGEGELAFKSIKPTVRYDTVSAERVCAVKSIKNKIEADVTITTYTDTKGESTYFQYDFFAGYFIATYKTIE
ncbi:MAG: hypothetical protein LBD22_06350 [Spirochaetaceae bacterium]|jgi:hypothetical protein|nr:hypothetical protein [Spirochaetaceae bacterium]